MYTINDISLFKGDIKSALSVWGESKINQLCTTHPKIKMVSPYLKRGLHNWLDRNSSEIDTMIDTTMLFVADKNGNIDFNTAFNDALEMFKSMEKQTAKLGAFALEYGQGELILHIPHNAFMDIVFGELGQIKINAEDIAEFQQLLLKE